MSKVAVIKTSPKTVINDYEKVMNLARYEKILSKKDKILIKLNLSWTLYYPSCSTQPWQLEGVLNSLKKKNYENVLAVENQTVVTHPWKGAYYNKWLPILKKYKTRFEPLTDVKWIKYKPKKDLLAMNEIFKEILIPKMFIGSNMIHLPTMKTHGHTITTGAIKNSFGGLIPKYRHHAHKKIHEILVDLLILQKEIHKGIFAICDGSVCGNGAGPRTMQPVIGDMILASEDQVAIDAIAAKIMGFDPLKIKYIKMAHDQGLGIGDTDQIDIVSKDKQHFKKLNLGFKVKKSPVISWDQILRKKTSKIPWLHNLLFNSPLFKTFIFASEYYHDQLWYPWIGKPKIKRFNKTKWGRLFESYPYGEFPRYTEVKDWDPY